MTEYDCGPTSMANAISFLFKREEISPDIPKYIMQYCMDAYNSKGEAYKSGTTCYAMDFLASWLNHFGKMRKFPIHCEMIKGEEVYIGQNSSRKEQWWQRSCLGAVIMCFSPVWRVNILIFLTLIFARSHFIRMGSR